MGMSTRVTGFAPPGAEWQRMKAIWDACADAQVAVPAQVEDFFGGEPPDPAGVEIGIPAREYHGDMEAGYEIDVAAIPPQAAVIRFVNSW
jgi:hypothetical protein